MALGPAVFPHHILAVNEAQFFHSRWIAWRVGLLRTKSRFAGGEKLLRKPTTGIAFCCA